MSGGIEVMDDGLAGQCVPARALACGLSARRPRPRLMFSARTQDRRAREREKERDGQ